MNNFDTSTSGVNLELYCHRDIFLSESDREDSMVRVGDYGLENPNFGNLPLFSLVNGGAFKTIQPSDITNYKFKKSDLFDATVDLFYGTATIGALAAEWHNKPKSRVTIADLVEYIENDFSESERAVFFYENLTPKFDVVSVCGYSQGDYCEVIVPEGASANYDTLQNLIYGTIALCKIVIDGEEYYLDEGLSNLYDYDKNEIVEYAAEVLKEFEDEKRMYILQWLEENLTDDPPYV